LGQVYELLGKTELALFYYHQSVLLKQDYRALLALADCFLSHTKQSEKALQYYELALANRMAHDNVHLKIGHVKRLVGDHSGALQHFQAHLDLNPHLTRTSMNDDPLLVEAFSVLEANRTGESILNSNIRSIK